MTIFNNKKRVFWRQIHDFRLWTNLATTTVISVLMIVLIFFGFRNHKRVNKKKEELTISKSGELVFRDKKVTYFIKGPGMPCIFCADSYLQSNCLCENLENNFQFIFSEPGISTCNAKDYLSL